MTTVLAANLKSFLRQHGPWCVALVVLCIGFRHTLVEFWKLSLSIDHYSHLAVIPFLSAFLLYWHRKQIFAAAASALGVGILIAICSVPLLLLARATAVTHDVGLFANGLALVVLVLAAFIACYGTRALRAALFPLLLLFLAVPLPSQVVETVIVFLQKGSATVCEALFSLTGVPFFREGQLFHLPRLTIEIAQECSGIRSSIGLLITTLLAVHLLLRTWWKQALVVLCVVPLVLLKNGVRIVTLSLLAIYVDPGFLSGWLHTSGGIVFYLLALAVIGILIRILKKDAVVSEPATRARAV